jgi:hypothetical protein
MGEVAVLLEPKAEILARDAEKSLSRAAAGIQLQK